jgi:hypothetical protein
MPTYNRYNETKAKAEAYKEKMNTEVLTGNLSDYHNHAERLLYKYYEANKSNLPDIPISDQELGEMAYHQALAEKGFDPSRLSADGRYYDGVPIGKVVI